MPTKYFDIDAESRAWFGSDFSHRDPTEQSRYEPCMTKGKIIVRVDKKGEIARFQTVREAAQQTGVSESSISNCLHGRYHKVRGYRFFAKSKES